MCNFWTCILTSDGKAHYNKDSSSHEELIKKLKLDDGEPDGKPFSAEAIKQRQFVRIEVTPKETLLIASKKPEDWALKVDEEATLPEWFTTSRKAHESAIWKAWAKAMRVTLWKLNIEKLPALIEETKAIKFFSQNSPPNPEWKMHYGKTWDAAWVAVFQMLPPKMLQKYDPDGKHRRHMQARMEVWKKGYGLLCDVDGVLYCYGVNKPEPEGDGKEGRK